INASSADLLISLHINSIYDPSVRGPIAFYAGGKPESKRLARAIHNQINPLFSADAKPGQLVHQQPQESNAYYILNQTTMPGILLEIAFMTNPDDRRLLKNKSFRKKMVQKIFLGVVEYSYGQEANEKDLSE
ncbi:MAG: N-acetylmuramoyl-L-alanine amidase, partial [Dethiobacteria bacterium]